MQQDRPVCSQKKRNLSAASYIDLFKLPTRLLRRIGSHVKYGLHHPFDEVFELEQLFTFKFKSIASLTLWHPLEAVNDFLVIAPR
jgi:hypothetical protein